MATEIRDQLVNPQGRRARFKHHRLRSASRRAFKRFRTIKSGKARIVLGVRRTGSGPRGGKTKAVSVLTPKRKANPIISFSRGGHHYKAYVYPPGSKRAGQFGRVWRTKSNPAGSLVIVNPRGRKSGMAKSRRRSGSSKLKRVLRLAAKLRKRGVSSKAALKKARAKVKHKRTRSRVKNLTRHARKRASASRRLTMARHKRHRRVKHRRHHRRHLNPMGHRRHRVHRRHRSHRRRSYARRSRFSLTNPFGGKLLQGVSVKEIVGAGVGALAVFAVSNRFVVPFAAKYIPNEMAATAVSGIVTTAALGALAGMVLGKDVAKAVVVGGLTYTVFELGSAAVVKLVAPKPQLPPPAAAASAAPGMSFYTPGLSYFAPETGAGGVGDMAGDELERAFSS